MTLDEVVAKIGEKLIACGVSDVAVGTSALYWTAKNGRRSSWHLSNASMPIAKDVLCVLYELAASESCDVTVRDAVHALLELTQLAIQGAGGHKSDWGSQSL